MVTDRGSIVETVQSVANRNGMNVHSIRMYNNDQKVDLDMHIEVRESFSVAEAHESVERVENQLRSEIANLGEISIHIEPMGDQESRHEVSNTESEQIKAVVAEIPKLFPMVTNCHNIVAYQENETLSLSFHCNFPPEIKITEAHKLTASMEQYLHKQIPELDRVYIHAEPLEQNVAE